MREVMTAVSSAMLILPANCLILLDMPAAAAIWF